MKKRLLNFFALALSVLIICGCVVGYVELQNIRVRELENKAIIAQVQAAIIRAQGQMIVNKAVAFQLYTNSLLLIVLAVAPLLLAVVLVSIIIYQLLDNNAQLQKYYTNNSDV